MINIRHRSYKNVSELNKEIRKVINMEKFWNDRGLVLIAPDYFRFLIGINSKIINNWLLSKSEVEKKMYESFKNVENFLLANLSQDCVNNAKNTYYRLPLLKNWSEDYKNIDTNMREEIKDINITIKKGDGNGF